MDKQAIINKVYRHFVTEDKPYGYNHADKSCQYRNLYGAVCAVGLLSSAEYVEGEPIEDQPGHVLLALGVEDSFDITFLSSLQRAHDHSAMDGDSKGRLAEKLFTLAKTHNLTINVD